MNRAGLLGLVDLSCVSLHASRAAAQRRRPIARLVACLNDPKLLFRRPTPPTRRSADQFNPLIPRPSELSGCPVETGASSPTKTCCRCRASQLGAFTPHTDAQTLVLSLIASAISYYFDTRRA
jgi:hypothetical protein